MASGTAALKTLRLIFSFYKRFCLATLGVTACCISIWWYQGPDTLAPLFWFKIITLLLVWYFMDVYQSKTFYYYWNLGISKTLLFVSTLTFDFLIFIMALILTYQIQ